MIEYISRETLRDLMYTEAFERDTGLQRWDSGLWIRYKLFENCLEAIPAADVVERPRWIPVTERLPEECEGLDWREEMMIRFTSVWCCNAKTRTLEVRNRYQGKMTGNEYLDQHTNDTDWHWSKSWWEPTHWMPIVPLPKPPKEKA